MKKIGMRNIKTGIAVFLATFAGYLGIVETPVYTVSVCIFSIKNTIKNSISLGGVENSIEPVLPALIFVEP